jgi:hypothetical protein
MSLKAGEKTDYLIQKLEEAKSVREEESSPAVYSGDLWTSEEFLERYQQIAEETREMLDEIDEDISDQVYRDLMFGTPGAAVELLENLEEDYDLN